MPLYLQKRRTSSRSVAPSDYDKSQTIRSLLESGGAPLTSESRRNQVFGTFGLFGYVLASSLIPTFIIFRNYDTDTKHLAGAVATACIANIIFTIETLASVQFRILFFLQKMKNPITLLTTIPWSLISLAVFGDSIYTHVALSLFILRLGSATVTYWPSFLAMIKRIFPNPPLQIIRLTWLAVVILCIQALSSSTYYFLGTHSTVGSSWIDVDDLRDDNSTRQLEDPSSAGTLRFARSFYYVWQTLLTLGYGDVAPVAAIERVFGLILCLAGVFLMAYMIANLTSFLVNLDSTPAAHRHTVDSVDAFLSAQEIPSVTRKIVRRALDRVWIRSKGLTRKRVFDDLPPALTRKILEFKAQAIISSPLFWEPETRDPCFRVILYLVDKVEPSIFDVGRTIRDPWDMIPYRPGLMWFLMTGTASKRRPKNNRAALKMALGDPATPVRRSFRAQALSKFTTSSHAEAPGRDPGEKYQVNDPRVHPNDMEYAALERSFTNSSAVLWGGTAKGRNLYEPHEDLISEIHENYPNILLPGRSVGALGFFNVLHCPPPRYVALTRCEILFLNYVDFRRMALLFPEWKMEETSSHVVRAMDDRRRTESDEEPQIVYTPKLPIELDSRIINQLDAECSYSSLAVESDPEDGNSTDDSTGPGDEMNLNHSSDDTLNLSSSLRRSGGATKSKRRTSSKGNPRRASTKIAALMQQQINEKGQQKKGWAKLLARFEHKPGSLIDVTWDCVLAIVFTSYGIFIPIHIAMIVAGIPLPAASLLLGFGAFIGDSIAIASWRLRPILCPRDESDAEKKKSANVTDALILQTSGHRLSGAFISAENRRASRQGSMSRRKSVSTQVALSQGLWSSHQEKLARVRAEMASRVSRVINQALSFAEILLSCLMFITLALSFAIALGNYSNDRQQELRRVMHIMRTPFLIRLFSSGRLIDRLCNHVQTWIAQRKLAGAVRLDDLTPNNTPGDELIAKNRMANSEIEELAGGEKNKVFISARLCVYFVLWAHFTACFGLVIAEESSIGSTRTSVASKYIVGIYWSLTTITTTGFGDIVPDSTRDSLVTTTFAIIGIAVYSCLVSFIGTLLKDTEFSDHNMTHQRTCVMALLFDKEISMHIQTKVSQYLQYVEARDILAFRRVLGISEDLQAQRFRHYSRVKRDNILYNVSSVPIKEESVLSKTSPPSSHDFLNYSTFLIKSCDRTTCPESFDSDFLCARERDQLLFDLTRDILKSSTLLSNVSEIFLHEACTLLDYRVVSCGDIVISESDPEWSLFFLFHGSMEVRGENDVKIRNIVEGQVFGERSFALMSHTIRENFDNDDHIKTKDFETDREEDFENQADAALDLRTSRGGMKGRTTSTTDHSRVIALTPCELWVLQGRSLRYLESMFPQDKEKIIAAETALNIVEHRDTVSNNLRRGGKLAKMAGSEELVVAQRKGHTVFAINSRTQQWWKVLMFFVLMWNLFIFPLDLAFAWSMNSPGRPHILENMLDVLLIIDVFLRLEFFELEITDGERISDPKEFRPLYLRSLYGIADIISAVPIDLFVVAAGKGLIPVSRINKLFRAVRLFDHVSSLGSHVKNQAHKSIITISKLIFVFLLVAHWEGCLFYSVGMASVINGEASWVDDNHTGLLQLPGDNSQQSEQNKGVAFIDDSSKWYEHYISALYFAVAASTSVGYGDVVPVSHLEVLYTIAVLLFAGLLYAVIIAFLEDIVAQSDLTSTLYQKKADLLGAFTQMHRLPNKVKAGIRSYLFRIWMHQKGVKTEKILNYLGKSLREQITIEIVGEQNLRKTPVIGPSRLWRFLVHDFKFDRYRRNSLLYYAGQDAENVFFILKGTVEIVSPDLEKVFYTVEAGGISGIDSFFRPLQPGYMASARCKGSCEVAILNRRVVNEALANNPHLMNLFKEELRVFLSKPSQLEHTKRNLDKRKLTKMFQDGEERENSGKRKFDLNNYILLPSDPGYTLFYIFVFAITIVNGIIVPLWATAAASEASTIYTSSTSLVFVIVNILMDMVLWLFIGLQLTVIAQVKNGQVMNTVSSIRHEYMRSGNFAMDLIATFPLDFIALAAGASLRVVFALRVLRLLWHHHLPVIVNTFNNSIDASSSVTISSGYRHLLKIVATVIIATHWLACGYGRLLLYTREDYQIVSITGSYVNHLYYTFYSVTTIGYGNVEVIGVSEKIYAIMVMVVGSFLCNAGIVSTLVSIIEIEDSTAAAGNRRKDAALQMANCFQYPDHIKNIIRTYYDNISEKNGVNDQECLDSLPLSLKSTVMDFLAFSAVRASPARCKCIWDFRDGLLVTLVRKMRIETTIPMELLYKANEPMFHVTIVMQGCVLVFGAHDIRPEALNQLASSPSAQERSRNGSVIEEYLPPEQRSLELWNPGLLLPSLAWGEASPVTLVSGNFCEMLLCDKDTYEAIAAMRPCIGGLYSSISELCDSKEDLKHLCTFAKRRVISESIDFVQAVKDYRNAPNNTTILEKRARVIVDRFIQPESEESININPELVSSIVDRVTKDPSHEIFDEAYKIAVSSLEKDILPQFKASEEYEKMIANIHRRSVLDFFPESL